ncbi:hypothetical protein [Escherichia coli]|nr:hypothetical protein [Escherichia coli]
MVKPSFKSLAGRSRTVCVGCGYSGVRFGDAAGLLYPSDAADEG